MHISVWGRTRTNVSCICAAIACPISARRSNVRETDTLGICLARLMIVADGKADQVGAFPRGGDE